METSHPPLWNNDTLGQVTKKHFENINKGDLNTLMGAFTGHSHRFYIESKGVSPIGGGTSNLIDDLGVCQLA